MFAMSTVLSACETEPSFLGLDPASAMDLMSRGSYEFLLEVDVPADRISDLDIYAIDSGSAYYASIMLEDLGRRDLSFALLVRQHDHGVEPWASRAALRMLETAGNASQRDEAADAVGELFSAGLRDEAVLAEYMETLWHADRHDDMTDRYTELGQPDSLAAWAALAASASVPDSAPEAVRRAIRVAPRGRGIVLLADYLHGAPEAAELTAFERDLLAFRSAVAEADWQPAADLLRVAGDEDILAAAAENETHPLWYRPVLGDLREAWFRRRESASGARTMQAISASLAGQSASYALEASGRLWRAENDNTRAVAVLLEAVDGAARGEDLDRVLYHLLHAQISYDHEQVIAAAERYLPLVSDPRPFNGIWERLLSHLIVNRRWQDFAGLYAPLRRSASDRTMAQYGVVLSVALDAGLVRAAWISDAPDDPRRYLLEAAYLQNESIYYRMLSAAMLDAPLRGMPDDTAVLEPDAALPDDLLVAGYLDYGLVDSAYTAVRDKGLRPGAPVLRRLAVALAQQGDYLRSLRTVNRLIVTEGEVLDSRLARIIYPEAFLEQFERVLEEFPLERDIFYGLVREESYFSPGIQSRVGATGLAQLMPQTAADVAARLRVSEYDLSDPYTNLRFGARYLNDLFLRFDAWVPSLIAYNAGQGRVRTWLAERQGLPMVLFHESVPFEEPRSYIRNIVVSAVFYEVLGGRGDGTRVIELLFPETGQSAR